MLILNDITVRMVGRVLIDHGSATLPSGSKTGFVGRNGTGKSTLFKVITGELSSDTGDISIPKNTRIGQVAQEAPGTEESLIEIVLKADKERLALLQEAETATDPARISEIHIRLADIESHSAEARASAILSGLGFDAEAQLRPASSFSGGWRMRVALAAVLFAQPPALDEIGSAMGEVTDMRVKPSGTLRLTMPRSAAYMHLLPRLKDFTRAYPEITLDLSIQDRFVDIVAEGFDAGIRLNESLERDMIAARLGGELRILVVATPEYFSTYGKPQHPDNLDEHNCICFRFASGRLYRWELEKAGQAREMAVQGSVIVDDSVLIKQIVMEGTGIGFVFESLIRHELEQGLLETALEDWCPSFPGLYLYYPSRNHMRPALRAFIDFYK